MSAGYVNVISYFYIDSFKAWLVGPTINIKPHDSTEDVYKWGQNGYDIVSNNDRYEVLTN